MTPSAIGSESAVKNAVQCLLDIGVEVFTPTEELLQKTIHAAFRTGLSFYDSLYVALASELGAHLLTADKTIARKVAGFLPVVLIP